MAAPYLYRTTGITVNSITLTVTHSLSRTATRLDALVTDRNATGNVFVVGINTNTVLLRATADASNCDLRVLEWHSMQGGPGPSAF